MESFECEGEDCEMAPLICNKCSYKSKEEETKGKRYCRSCRAAEKMRAIEDEEEDLDTTPSGIKLVSSVAYDKGKKKLERGSFEGDPAQTVAGDGSTRLEGNHH